MAETGLVWGLGIPGDRAIALQVTTPSPWGQFHDLRWLLVFHDSWLTLALGGFGVVAARSLMNSFLVRQSSDGPSPPFSAQVLHEALFAVVMLLLLAPWAVMGFGLDVVSISWLFFTAIPPVLAIALASGHGSATREWWHRVPPRQAVGWTAATFGVVSLAGLATQSAAAGWWLPIAAATGAWNAWAWRGIVTAVQQPRAQPRWVPLAPAVGVGIVVVAVSGAAIAFAVVGSRRSPSGSPVAGTAKPNTTPVMVVSGFDSALNADTVTPSFGLGGGYAVVRFSYRGMNARAEPLDYTASYTHESLPDLVRTMASEVQDLHRITGRRVDIVAESEGSLIAEVYAAAYPDAPVGRLVLLSPLDQPGRVYYPPGDDEGFGVATGRALQLVTDLLGGISPIHLNANSPFLRSVVSEAPALRGLLSCPTRPAEDLLEPLADALADPYPPTGHMTVRVLPAFHGGLLTNHEAQSDVGRLIAGKQVKSDASLDTLETIMRRASSAWQLPTLPLSLFSSSPDNPSCARMTSEIRSWIAKPAGR